jgi:hypothetical protein
MTAFLSVLSMAMACNRPTYHDRQKLYEHSSTALNPSPEIKKKILLAQFWNDTPLKLSFVEQMATENLASGLVSTGKVIIAEQTEVKTEDFVKDNSVHAEQLIRLSKKSGASAVIIGKIADLRFSRGNEDVGILGNKSIHAFVTLEVKAFESRNGQEILSLVEKAAIERPIYSDQPDMNLKLDAANAAIQEATLLLVREMGPALNKLSWQGQIADIRGDLVYLSAGRVSGLLVGDILRVLSKGEDVFDKTGNWIGTSLDIIDSATGNFIGSSPGKLKGTLEVIDLLGNDACAARINSGGGFEKADTVMLY